MNKEEDKISKESPTKDEDFLSTKRRAKDLQHLILLHKRFEEKALRFYRRGYVSPPLNSTEDTREKNFSRDLSRRMMLDYLPRIDYVNDDDYIKELLNENYEGGKHEKNSGLKSERLTLKLPKLETISAENKTTFYTTLPKVPSLQAKNVNKLRKRGVLSSSKNVTKYRNSKSKDESFFKVKPALLSCKEERFIDREDLNAIQKVRESNRKVGSQIQIVLPKVGSIKDADGKEVDEKPGVIPEEEEENLPKNPEFLKVEVNEKFLQKSKGKNEKNVQFCELLHEVRVYSPSMPSSEIYSCDER